MSENNVAVEINEDDDARYVLAPKMIAYSALEEAEFIDDWLKETVQMKLFWKCFVEGMKKAGWIKDDE